MTVKDLIKKLKKFDDKTTVVLEYEKEIGWFDIDVVEKVAISDIKESAFFINIGHVN